MFKRVEIYTTPDCPHCACARENLALRGVSYAEFDVQNSTSARARMLTLTDGVRKVPVIVQNGKTVAVGWLGNFGAI